MLLSRATYSKYRDMPKDTTSFGTVGNRSSNLLITSPTPSPLSHLTPSDSSSYPWCGERTVALTRGGDDPVSSLAAEPGQEAGLPRPRQSDTHHIILRPGDRWSFTAQGPETLEEQHTHTHEYS